MKNLELTALVVKKHFQLSENAKKDEDIVSDKNNLFCFETVRL